MTPPGSGKSTVRIAVLRPFAKLGGTIGVPQIWGAAGLDASAEAVLFFSLL
jgi:hypothetical protein